MKKYIKYILICLLVIGLCLTKGNLFELINIIIVYPITNILFIIYDFIGDFGLAIIIFTVLVKLCMWPLSKSQLHQTKLMKKIQPELLQIRKNCNGNKQMESLQTMDLYKKYNVRPFRSVITLLIQLPIFIALYSAIRIMVLPTTSDNLRTRAYSFVQYDGSRISEVIELQDKFLSTEDSVYDFHPKLFNNIPLDGYASQITENISTGTLFALICAILASVIQYMVTKGQQPSDKSIKSKKFRDLLKEAENGKEPNTADMTAMTTGSMNKIMPFMMFMIMFNLPGALVFYYFLSNSIALVQQKLIFKKANQEMDNITDKNVLKELKHIKEAEIIENKKTGTKITRISSKDNNKKRR